MEPYKATLNFFQPCKKPTTDQGDHADQAGPGNQAGQADIPTSSLTSSTSRDPIPSLFHQGSSDEAHIICALNCVKYGYSDNSVNDFGSVLRRLCPDSKIAGNFLMGRKKTHVSRELELTSIFEGVGN